MKTASDVRERASRKADDVRERATHKAQDVGHKAVASPGTLGTIGAILGGVIGMRLAKNAREKQRHERARTEYYGYGGGFRTDSSYVSRDYLRQPSFGGPDYSASPEVGGYAYGRESWSEPWRSRGAEADWAHSYEEEGPSRGEELRGKADEFRDKASSKADELREKASSKADELRGRAAGTGEQLRDKAHGVTEQLKHRASEVKERVSSSSHELRDKVSSRSHELRDRAAGSTGEARSRMAQLRDRAPSSEDLRHSAQEHPAGLLLGGILIGAAAAALLPLTGRERQVMHPAKEKARSQLGEQFHELQQRVEEKFGGDTLDSGSSGEERQASTEPQSPSDFGLQSSETPIQQSSTDLGPYNEPDTLH